MWNGRRPKAFVDEPFGRPHRGEAVLILAAISGILAVNLPEWTGIARAQTKKSEAQLQAFCYELQAGVESYRQQTGALPERAWVTQLPNTKWPHLQQRFAEAPNVLADDQTLELKAIRNPFQPDRHEPSNQVGPGAVTYTPTADGYIIKAYNHHGSIFLHLAPSE